LLLPIFQPISIAFHYIIPSSPDDSRINNCDFSRKLVADSLPPLGSRPTAPPRNKTPQKKKEKTQTQNEKRRKKKKKKKRINRQQVNEYVPSLLRENNTAQPMGAADTYAFSFLYQQFAQQSKINKLGLQKTRNRKL
jgi:TPP-dependent 2-oxoacid decarboxylase